MSQNRDTRDLGHRHTRRRGSIEPRPWFLITSGISCAVLAVVVLVCPYLAASVPEAAPISLLWISCLCFVWGLHRRRILHRTAEETGEVVDQP